MLIVPIMLLCVTLAFVSCFSTRWLYVLYCPCEVSSMCGARITSALMHTYITSPMSLLNSRFVKPLISLSCSILSYLTGYPAVHSESERWSKEPGLKMSQTIGRYTQGRFTVWLKGRTKRLYEVEQRCINFFKYFNINPFWLGFYNCKMLKHVPDVSCKAQTCNIWYKVITLNMYVNITSTH